MLVANPAGAIITYTNLNGPQRVTMRVGSANGTINSVNFSVTGANVSPTPVPVTGVPGNFTPATAPANGTEIQVTANIGSNSTRTITLSVDSSAGLACVGGSGCGTTIIPFSTVSWTSYNKETGLFAGEDLQDGTFTGATNQVLASGVVSTNPGQGIQVVMTNVMIFRYNNAVLYPSGQYTGRVVYTATNV